MIQTKRLDYETTVNQTNATDETTVTVPGLRDEDRNLGTLVGVQIDYVGTDKGARTGAAISTARFKAIPKQQHGLMGGDIWHTFAAVDSEQQNRVPFGNGIVLRPGEDLTLTWNNGTAARTLVARVGRTLIYDDGRRAA